MNDDYTSAQFLTDSERTEKKFPDGLFLTTEETQAFVEVATNVMFRSFDMDRKKRELVYDSFEDDDEFIARANAAFEVPTDQLVDVSEGLQLSQRQAEMLHAAMGVVTEAGELLLAVCNNLLTTQDLDLTNIDEEQGDSYFYHAIIHRLNQSRPEDLMQINTEKLMIRFPEGFDADDVVDRDLAAEHEVLAQEA